MILSRLILNPRSREVRRDLADIQQLHRTVMSVFPQSPPDCQDPRHAFGVLFYLEANGRGIPKLLVQSQAPPDWSKLPASYLDSSEFANPDTKDISTAYSALAPGTVLRFRLRANPTRKIDTRTGADGNRRNGKRVELRTEETQLQWLERKGTLAGFQILSAKINPAVPNLRAIGQGKLSGLRANQSARGASASKITFASVLFEGLLRVTDPDAFRSALEGGVGSGKAYGFGLLSIAPAGGAT